MEIVPRDSELQKVEDHSPFIVATAGQINKDFGTFGIEVFHSTELPETWDQLFAQFRPAVHSLAKQSEQKLVQIFYRVDLNERLLKECLSSSPFEEAIDEITVMLIRRELKKVLYRIKYSKPGENNLPSLGSTD